MTDERENIKPVRGERENRKSVQNEPTKRKRGTEQHECGNEVKNEKPVHNIRAMEILGKGRKLETKKSWASLGVGDNVVESAADESCWPKDVGGAFKTKPSVKNILLRTASGGEMSQEITFLSGEETT